MKPKKESGRKILSILLTFALIVSLVPAMTLTAGAAETDDAVVIEQDENRIGAEENVPGQEDFIPGSDKNTIEQEDVLPEPDENSIGQEETDPAPQEDGTGLEKALLDQDGSISYLEASWNETDKKVEYTEKSVTEYTEVTNGTETNVPWSGWYVVKGTDVAIHSRINVSGTANLILCDNATLTVSKGITVTGSNTLNIFAQSDGGYMGKLVINSVDKKNAGIGGGDHGAGGTVTIHGGTINVGGGEKGAGIGGGECGAGGSVTIYGGAVTATGGSMGAGIGGGDAGSTGSNPVDYGGTVIIHGGMVCATGGSMGAGIGGGHYSNGGVVTIHGGTVRAVGQDNGAGIGGGLCGAGGTVTINGGDVTAIGDLYSQGIGKGGNGRGIGELILGEGVKLFGNARSMPDETGKPIATGSGSAYTGDRYRYMRTQALYSLAPSGGEDYPVLLHIHAWESVGAVPATFKKAGHTAGIVCKECGEYLLKPVMIDKIRSVTLNKKKFTYTGAVQRPVVTVKDSAGAVITANNYMLSYSDKSSKTVGSYTVTVTFRGSYSGKKTLNYSIVQAKNPLKVSPLSKTYKQTALKSAQSFTIKATKAQGKVTYTPNAAAKKAKIKVTSKGKVTIPKNCKKGTYKITVKAKGNKNYKAGTKTVIITIK